MAIRKCLDCGFHYQMGRRALRCEPCAERHTQAARKSPDALRKNAARALTKQAIAEGKLQWQPCEMCASSRSHAHHVDYDDPLNIRWLCAAHHTKQHAFLRWHQRLAEWNSPAEIERIISANDDWAAERDFAKNCRAIP